jgi:glucose-1-phosphate thymidylyltransferase
MTSTSNKHLIPIANKPMLFYAIEAVAEAGIRQIGIVFGPESHAAISAAIAPYAREGLRFTLMIQEAPRGLAHVVKLAEPFVAGEPFVFYLGDNLMTHDIRQSIRQFETHKADCLLVLAKVRDPQRFGVAELRDGRVIGVVEKPANPKSPYAVTGLYCYDQAIFEAVSSIQPSARGELEISDAHQYLIDHGFTVDHTEVSGWWKDTGKPEDLLEANRLVLGQRSASAGSVIEGEVDSTSTVAGAVIVEAGARVTASRLRGPLIIGAGSVIEGSVISPFTAIGPRCRVTNSEVEDSILLEGCRIVDAGVRIVHSLIGRDVEIVKSRAPQTQRLIIGDQSRIEVP